jgi:phosphatidylinositol-3,4,5-trisphosphate 3-phosphatase/dual-specificity protein phosphatase PTEN
MYELAVGIPPLRSTTTSSRKEKSSELSQRLAAYHSSELRFPPFVSSGFCDLVRALLEAKPTARLGSGSTGGVDAVKKHAYWTAKVNWDAIDPLPSGGGSMSEKQMEVPVWLAQNILNIRYQESEVRAANPNATPDQLLHFLSGPPKHPSLSRSGGGGGGAAQMMPKVNVTLSNTFHACFGFVEGGEDYTLPSSRIGASSKTSTPLEVSHPVTAKFATPGTRGRTSVFGELMPPGSVAALAAQGASKRRSIIAANGGALIGAGGGGAFHSASVMKPIDLGMTPPPPPSKDATGAMDDEEDEDEDDDGDDQEESKSKEKEKVKTGGQSVLRGLVSKKKLRYQEEGFDLDLSYITPRIIAMGFPSEGAEAVYRNPMDQVQKFFKQKHDGRFRVYNLCSERHYDHSKFNGSVCNIAFNDHGPPGFSLVMSFCRDAHKFLSQNPENVIAVHCKAGKGRTGTMIAAYLLYEQHCMNAEEALNFFGSKRTKNSKGVTIPSQRRYVNYFAEFLHRYRDGNRLPSTIPSEPPAVALRLKHIRFHTVPNFDIGGGCDPYFKIKGPPPAEEVLYDYRKALKAHGLKVQNCHEKGRTLIELAVPGDGGVYPENGICDVKDGAIVVGDFKVCFLDEDTMTGDDPMFHIWLHTAFIDPQTNHVELRKLECDKAHKGANAKRFEDAFKVELWFVPAEI